MIDTRKKFKRSKPPKARSDRKPTFHKDGTVSFIGQDDAWQRLHAVYIVRRPGCMEQLDTRQQSEVWGIVTKTDLPELGDPDMMNDQRRDSAELAIQRYRKEEGSDHDEQAFRDLLVNLFHYAEYYGYDMADEIDKAQQTYREETLEC